VHIKTTILDVLNAAAMEGLPAAGTGFKAMGFLGRPPPNV
jgi:hypothetical protein